MLQRGQSLARAMFAAWGRSTLRAITCAMLLLSQTTFVAPAHAQDTSGGDIDMAAVARCQNTLTNTYGLSSDDPSYLDALNLCYSVETAPDSSLDPLPVAVTTTNNGGGCFAAGSKVMVSQSEIDEMTQFRRDAGGWL